MKQKNESTPSVLTAVHKLRALLTRKEKIKCLMIALLALLVSVFEIITASSVVLFAQVLSDPSAGKQYMESVGIITTASSGKIIFYFVLIVAIVYFIKSIIVCIEVFFQNFSIQNMCYELKKKMLQYYSDDDYERYAERHSSFGILTINSYTEQTFSTGMLSLAGILSEGIVFVCLIGAIIYMNPALALIIFLIGTVLTLFLFKVLLPCFYHWGQRLQDVGIAMNKHLIQFFHAFKEILLLGRRDFFIQAYSTHAQEKAKVQAMQTATNSLPRIGIEMLFVGMFVLSVSWLAMQHESPLQMIGLLSGYLYAGFRLMPGLNRIINQLNTFKSVIPNIENLHREYTVLSHKENYQNVPDFQFTDSIIISDMTFRYRNTDKDTLCTMTLEIKKEECLGIAGETGSGKSTLIDVLLGLLRPSAGSVLVDGKYPVHSYQWHEKIGYVPQAIYLTDDTIEANIAFGEYTVDKEKLYAAIDAAQLRTLTDSLPEGVNTVVGEHGIRLSGGERQRIAIARALYRDPEVLIFDEATSALDSATETRLIETIRTVSENRTVIMIAHRLTTLKNCDRIVQMKNGKIQAITNYDTLCAS